MCIKLIQFPHQLKRVSEPPFKAEGAHCEPDKRVCRGPYIKWIRWKRYNQQSFVYATFYPRPSIEL